ncbi:MAG: DinB family protein [Chloroflexi bacterium AL-W]|nr:DinB family protein [Chloroflexi bacterium AL-N1]NOK64883.1 DinB family protein [Chloroflexi bacterium AL-N10]NOK76653.1 DinB family protein [Chloroflexi bacterium AL-N5]NOK84544.1 DinB family protein [Chloroflexi bacterium AL-W]NOK86631.1 DinB family protein [Chloroflexi bacterium AL-N15]
MSSTSAVVPLVVQLRFARNEFVRCLTDVTETDGTQRPPNMNSLSWIVGHLAEHEQHFYVIAAQGQTERDDLIALVGADSQPISPSFTAMWDIWKAVTAAADRF